MQQTGFSVSNVIYARRIASRLQAKRYLNRPYVRATDEYRANIQRISIRKTSVCSRRVRKAREHTDVFSPAATRDNKKCCGNRRRTAATACGQLTRILGRAIRIFRTGQQRRSLTADPRLLQFSMDSRESPGSFAAAVPATSTLRAAWRRIMNLRMASVSAAMSAMAIAAITP